MEGAKKEGKPWKAPERLLRSIRLVRFAVSSRFILATERMDDDIALGDEVELLTTSLERTDSPAGNKKPRKPSSHPSPL